MTDSYLASHLLHALAAQGNTRGLQAVLSRLDCGRREQILQQRDGDGFTVLMRAAENGHHQTVNLLLGVGARVEAVVSGEEPAGWGALHLAAFGDHGLVLQELLAAEADAAQQDVEGATPLMVAVARGSEAAFEVLLPASHPDIADDEGFTALHHAAYNGACTMIQALVGRGCQIDAVAVDGSTPLDWALAEGHQEAARVLRRNGARRGRTAGQVQEHPGGGGGNGVRPLREAHGE